MEDNSISMFIEVKLDIRERKLEFSQMKTWSRYFVRVEAVKCFPCYMRISFFKLPTDESTDLIVRINIPGLAVQMATSRTKPHSYGLFWKHNRKRCCAYFALETQLLCEQHLRWMKKSIRNLELHRQEILQLRRASRTPMCEIQQEMQPNVADLEELGIYQNLDNTQNILDVNEMLRPLPQVPQPSSSNEGHNQGAWLRRVSGLSGIYEEIGDGKNRLRQSRCSVASGIYEEMRIPEAKVPAMVVEQAEDIGTPPPPLPPRTRLNTNEDSELHRSFTTPEADFLKKKRNWLGLESVFGRRRTTSTSSNATKSEKKANKESTQEQRAHDIDSDKRKVTYREKLATHCGLADNKRNSFSSPDLSQLKISNNVDNVSDGDGSCTSEFYIQKELDYIEQDSCFVSSEFLNFSATSSLEGSLGNLFRETNEPLNVSERIMPRFNLSVNSSTVNLVGTSCNTTKVELPPPVSTAELEGYCEMGPIGTGFNRLKLDEVELRNSRSMNKSDAESIYMNMGGKETEPSRSSSTSSTSSSGVSSASNRSSSNCSAGKHRNSVDDKIASYYPNSSDGKGAKKGATVPGESGESVHEEEPPAARPENYYVCSPKTPHRNVCTLPRVIKSAQRPPKEYDPMNRLLITSRTPDGTRRCSADTAQSLPSSPLLHAKAATTENGATDKDCQLTSKIFQKYATLARLSANKYQEKTSAKKPTAEGDGATLPSPGRRFGAISRFGKIDLLPLRMKINSVLQRHNGGNM